MSVHGTDCVDTQALPYSRPMVRALLVKKECPQCDPSHCRNDTRYVYKQWEEAAVNQPNQPYVQITHWQMKEDNARWQQNLYSHNTRKHKVHESISTAKSAAKKQRTSVSSINIVSATFPSIPPVHHVISAIPILPVPALPFTQSIPSPFLPVPSTYCTVPSFASVAPTPAPSVAPFTPLASLALAASASSATRNCPPSMSVLIPIERPMKTFQNNPKECFATYHYALLKATAESKQLASKLYEVSRTISAHHPGWQQISGGSQQIDFNSLHTAGADGDELKEKFEDMMKADLKSVIEDAQHQAIVDEKLWLSTLKVLKSEYNMGNQIAHCDSDVWPPDHYQYSEILMLHDTRSTRMSIIPIEHGLNASIPNAYHDKTLLFSWLDEYYDDVSVQAGDRILFSHDVQHAGTRNKCRTQDRMVAFGLLSSKAKSNNKDERQIFPWNWARTVFGPFSMEELALIFLNYHRNPFFHWKQHDMSTAVKTIQQLVRRMAKGDFIQPLHQTRDGGQAEDDAHLA